MTAVFVDIGAGPTTGLQKDSDISMSRDAIVGFAVLAVGQSAAAAVFAKDLRCTERETALVKNRLVPALVDLSRAPCADTGHLGVLNVGINIEATRAFAGGPEPAAVDLVLKQVPLSAVVEIGGLVVCA